MSSLPRASRKGTPDLRLPLDRCTLPVCLVGLATLSGIVVNDSILLVTFIKEQYAGGISMTKAARAAAKARFKAIILTSLTTIAGLLPLLLETSTQAQFLIPLVASLAFGLFSATILSLLLIPSCFVVFEEMGWLQTPKAKSTVNTNN